MINIKYLSDKKKVNGKTILASNMSFTDFSKVEIDDYVIIDDMSEMKMSLISRIAYGSEMYTDVLCKFNNKGPFSIKKGDIIAIPNLVSYRQHTSVKNIKSLTIDSKDFTDAKNASSSYKSTPSKKKQKSANFTKSADGILVF